MQKICNPFLCNPQGSFRNFYVTPLCNPKIIKKVYVTPLFNPYDSENVYVTPFYVTPNRILKSLCNRFYVTQGYIKNMGGYIKKKTYGGGGLNMIRTVSKKVKKHFLMGIKI